MNQYCSSCKSQCEEVVPTFNCKYQMINSSLENIKILAQQINESIHNIHQQVQELSDKQPDNSITELDVINYINNSNFKKRCKIYSNCFSIGQSGEAIDSKLILISLIGTFYLKFKEKTPDISMIDVVEKLVESKDVILKEKIAVLTNDFIYGVEKGNTFGLKNGIDIKNKINEIIKNTTPF